MHKFFRKEKQNSLTRELQKNIKNWDRWAGWGGKPLAPLCARICFSLLIWHAVPFSRFPHFPSPPPLINVLDKGQSFVWFLLCVQPTATRQKNNYHWYKSAENTSMRRRAGVFTAHMLIYNIYICLIKMQQRTRCTPGFPSPVSRRTRIRDPGPDSRNRSINVRGHGE